MLSCLNAGDTILGFNLAHGGHLTHGSPVNFSGKLYSTSFYNVDKETGLIDYKMLEEVAQKKNKNDFGYLHIQEIGTTKNLEK